jgi:geranylgeranylglycerol-phosphate geranylgeranyltransferase
VSAEPLGQAYRPARTHRTWVTVLAHLEICRPDTIFYGGLVPVAGALLADPHTSPWRLAGVWAAITLGWISSLYGGDYFDRELDALAKPRRPIPSGRMRAGAAFRGMVVTIAAGAILAVLLNPRNIVLVVVTIVLGVSYARVFKARGLSGNLVRGGPTALAFVVGMMAAQPTPRWELLPFCLVFWLHDSASNLVGALCDKEGDRRGGYRTFPVRHGDAATVRVLYVVNGMWVALALVYPPLLGEQVDLAAYYRFLAPAVALGLVPLLMLSRERPISRLGALRAHEIIVVERLVLAAAVIAAADERIALTLLLPALGLTVVSRAIMRRRDHPSLRGGRRRPR